MDPSFRLCDFNVYNEKSTEDSSSGSEGDKPSIRNNGDKNVFKIQMFGLNELGETCSIIVSDFKPFFYVKVDDKWTIPKKDSFLKHIKNKLGNYYGDTICECKIIKRKKLYGFDGGKDHKFVKLSFNNMNSLNKAKNLWYGAYNAETRERKLLSGGYVFEETGTYLYEANIPPLLRFFHIQDISPSGWIQLPLKKCEQLVDMDKKTTCTYEYLISYKHIIPLNNNEKRVPYKICSFDIEASSSHGDFPVPIKSYKKLATNIIEYFENLVIEITPELCKNILRSIILCAFGYDSSMSNDVDLVYPKVSPKSKQEVQEITEKWMLTSVRGTRNTLDGGNIEALFERMMQQEDDDDEDSFGFKKYVKQYTDKKATIVTILCDKKFEREGKIKELNVSLNANFPRLEGDKVTFIGSTFLKYGEQEPYLNHCISLNTCTPLASETTLIESYASEREVLLAWKELIKTENPDIIIGYNIFGFDYEFMFRRAEENNCVEEFLKLSRNEDEVCGTMNRDTGSYDIEESSIHIASGQHDLRFIKMNGRLQVDLYNFFRREENLTSYKLDYVAGHFIGDYVKSSEPSHDNCQTTIKTYNLTGLLEGSFVHFEEIGHSIDYYADGQKFKVTAVNKTDGFFVVDQLVNPDTSKKVRWCLAKDDVTPKDIFRMTNGTADDRSVIAKYCIQDCNLVHYLMNKVDTITGFSEMAKICSVPMNFLVMRGQGIKLTSYIAKKCREKRTLMPVLDKGDLDEGYEGAIVLDPKCDIYLDNPVACVDYASLYPSSMCSENLSHDSKVWTKEYDLNNELLEEWGEKDAEGNFIYDNLTDYDYVNVEYDTYKYVRKNPKAAAEKVKSGNKICRFAQFKNGKAIMPSILEELLKARKDTRKQIPMQTDEFMKNVLDKRQLGYKVTANSLYGQCGAKTSTFYEKDIAACTTATGRLLLIYAKKIIEECYGDAICQTATHGPVLTKAEYIYGDSVANYTPICIKVNGLFDICTIEHLAEKYGNNNWIKCKEEGKQEKEFCELENTESWTEKGWTPLYRVIRHTLASHKKMMRVFTLNSIIDVTDDHSLLKPDGTEISPTDCKIGTELLSRDLHCNENIEILQKYFENKNIILENQPEINVENSIPFIQQVLYCKLNQIHNFMLNHGTIRNFEIIQSIEEIQYSGYVYDLTTKNHHFAAGVGDLIVHNTDSVFFTFNLQTPEGQPIRGKEALEITIELAQEAGHLASKFLKGPHDLEYEKTFMPFCLLSKKRYVGMLYEMDPNKGKRKEMGIVLKRRDNAPIVKDIYGGIIDILMKEKDIEKAIKFLRTSLQDIVDEKYPMDKLIITKSLRSGYKNPKSIAHKVLADRITARDPGSKPSSGDRIPFVYIHNKDKKALQGEKIETPTFIRETGAKIDYSFYITNQIMKPVQQVFALVLEKIWELQNKKPKIAKFKKDVEALRKSTDPAKFEDKLEDMKNKEVKALLFDEYLRKTNNEKTGNQALTAFFK